MNHDTIHHAAPSAREAPWGAAGATDAKTEWILEALTLALKSKKLKL